MPPDPIPAATQTVQHKQWGRGRVRFCEAGLAYVQFEHGLESCELAELTIIRSPVDQLVTTPGTAVEVILRAQANVIRSVNDAWGVFSRSRIALLPHQLWVCRQVTRTWPARWLVADDVGLGKTIEAGLIISAFKLARKLDRLLVICPASLVEQWQDRLRKMFEIRCAIYSPDQDTERRDFWATQRYVIASMQTLRLDRGGRRERMLATDPWDMVVVDEAHHLNADKERGPTLGFDLIRELNEHNKIDSMIFFTGTPHRGKDFGFNALLSLLRPDRFDLRKPWNQDASLRDVMIRNNKQSVTDLQGKKLFQKPTVTAHTYAYSLAEQEFYDTMTEFIESGRAYAGNLNRVSQREAVKLVLISLQKLASSSVAAVSRALVRRRERIRIGAVETAEAPHDPNLAVLDDDFDLKAVQEEDEAAKWAGLELMHDEEAELTRLIDLAAAVEHETKINAVLEHIGGLPADASVLLFTEYKATQSLIINHLIAAYGRDTVVFINGDHTARGITHPDRPGEFAELRMKRVESADAFNAGTARFLVSTEAAGEGIDLQENCHRLIHVDLPWNPMRLHQRVGRLNRFGQKHRVEVTYFHNPHTVESRIWEHLNTKIERITAAYGAAMDDPEDVLDLVLGVEGSRTFESLFASAAEVSSLEGDRLQDWFNEKTVTFGGGDAVATVQKMVGQAQRFDFGRDAPSVPRLDLPDLAPFFRRMVRLRQRQLREQDGRLSFKTPQTWRDRVAVDPSYEDLHFDREERPASGTLVGVGLSVFDRAIDDALAIAHGAAFVRGDLLKEPLALFQVFDRRTTGQDQRRAVCGIFQDSAKLIRDQQLLTLLNQVLRMQHVGSSEGHAHDPPREALDSREVEDRLEILRGVAASHAAELGVAASHPEADLLLLLVPES